MQTEAPILDQCMTLEQRTDLFFQAEDGIRDHCVTGVQTCAFLIQAEDGIRGHGVTGVQACAVPISGLPLDFARVSDGLAAQKSAAAPVAADPGAELVAAAVGSAP